MKTIKNKLALLFFIFTYLSLSVNPLIAQTRNDAISLQEFNNIVDFFNAEVSLNFFVNNPLSDINYIEKAKSELKNNSIDSPISEEVCFPIIQNNEQTLKIYNSIKIIKSKFNPDKDLISLLSISFTDEAINNGTLIKPYWDNAYQKILDHFQLNIDNNQPSAATSNVDAKKSNDPQSNDNVANTQNQRSKQYDRTDTFWLYIFIVIFFFLAVLISFYFSVKYSKDFTRDEIQELKKNFQKRENNSNIYLELQRSIKNLQSIYDQKFEKLEYQIRNLTNASSMHTENAPPNPPKRTESTPPAPPENRVFYISIPTAEGFFNNSQRMEYPKSGISMYKFELIGTNKATFSFECDEIAMRDALKSPFRYVDPVCEAENEIFNTSSKIKTIQPGLAVLQGDNWTVENKATIRYE